MAKFSIKVEGPRTFTIVTDAQVQALKARIRKTIMDGVTIYVRHRVRDQNLQRGRTSILGYSEQPITIAWKGDLKPYRRPRGGYSMGKNGMFFPGGYLEYRQKAGLGSAFSFYNTGDAWRDWKVLAYGSEGTDGQIGFTKTENAIAAGKAEATRPDLFSIDEHELDVVNARVIEQINATFFGSQNP